MSDQPILIVICCCSCIAKRLQTILDCFVSRYTFSIPSNSIFFCFFLPRCLFKSYSTSNFNKNFRICRLVSVLFRTKTEHHGSFFVFLVELLLLPTSLNKTFHGFPWIFNKKVTASLCYSCLCLYSTQTNQHFLVPRYTFPFSLRVVLDLGLFEIPKKLPTHNPCYHTLVTTPNQKSVLRFWIRSNKTRQSFACFFFRWTKQSFVCSSSRCCCSCVLFWSQTF